MDTNDNDKEQVDNHDCDPDPYLRLGFGVKSYLDTTLTLFKMFAVLTLACFPLFIAYGTYNY